MVEEKKKSWFKEHWIISIGIVFVFIIILGMINSGSAPASTSATNTKTTDNSETNVVSTPTSSTYIASEVEKMSLYKKLDICTKDIAGDSINIPQVKNQAYASCYEIYYSGGEEALNEMIVGVAKLK